MPGADPHSQTRSGQSPAEVAKSKVHFDVHFQCLHAAARLCLEDVRQAIEASAESDAVEEPPKKKATQPHCSARARSFAPVASEEGHPQAKRMPNYNLNINSAVDKAPLPLLSIDRRLVRFSLRVGPSFQEYEGSSLTDIVAAPTSALQGVAAKGREVLKMPG